MKATIFALTFMGALLGLMTSCERVDYIYYEEYHAVLDGVDVTITNKYRYLDGEHIMLSSDTTYCQTLSAL